jgi:hypothetical protein
MRKAKLRLLVVCVAVSCFMVSVPALGSSWFLIETEEQWNEAYYGSSGENRIGPMDITEWGDYMQHWGTPGYGPADPNVEREGEPYPENEFVPAQLYVYEGGGEDPCSGYQYPNDAGLVMAWLESGSGENDVNYSSAWSFVYGEDPDLRNCTIKITITPPCDPCITTVSFAMEDNGNPPRRLSWKWNVPGTIPCDQSTTVIINTAKSGLNATIPKADGYAGNVNFDMKNVVAFDVDENGQYIFGKENVPPPGQVVFMDMWNYWHNLIVLPNTGEGKYFIKWSQPPVPNDVCVPDVFLGWDEISDYEWGPIMADDWLCEDERPITDIHWWGSFLGWDQPNVPSVLPKAFHIGIWTDDPCDFADDFSHPAHLIWENYCDNWVWNFVGFDLFPWDACEPGKLESKEACFQFNQLLSQDEWFYQEPNDPEDEDPNSTVYWISIAAIYDPNDYLDPNFHPWGWKTRPHFFNDGAIRIGGVIGPWPPRVCQWYDWGDPIFWPDPETSWDLAFELTTNAPGPPPEDTNAPDPDPMAWDLEPNAVAPTVITMTAATATDISGVEYYFEETTGNPGGDDSGWQDSSGYTDSGLDPNTTYTYSVSARDKSPAQNQTGWSPSRSATTPLSNITDYNADGIVNFRDFAFFANRWLTSGP